MNVSIDSLAEGVHLEIETAHHLYSVVNAGGGKAWISGHPEYCPQPVEVLLGNTIVPGMRLEFRHPFHNLITTSRIIEIRQLS